MLLVRQAPQCYYASLGNSDDLSPSDPMRPAMHRRNLPSIIAVFGSCSGRSFGAFAAALVIASVFGCEPAQTTRSTQSRDQPQVHVPLEAVTAQRFDQAIQRLHGKVVVVDFWRTDCVACIYEFPRLVKLHDELAGQGLATISMNLDDPESKNVETRVRGFLEKRKADFTNLRLTAGEMPNDWIQERLKLSDGLPGQRVYDRNGKLVQTFTGEGNYEDIAMLVEKLLKQR